jgi:predicted aconitase with swiveling domain
MDAEGSGVESRTGGSVAGVTRQGQSLTMVNAMTLICRADERFSFWGGVSTKMVLSTSYPGQGIKGTQEQGVWGRGSMAG